MGVGTMNISTVKTENGDVSCETPEGTVVHININQRSAFDCFLDTFRFIQDLKKSGQKTKPSHMSGSAAHLGLGAAYISLGLVSVMLAIIICIVQPRLSLFYSEVHFWVGFPFLVSGILNLVAYKFPKTCWMALAFISLLVNFGVSIAGMVFAVDDIQRVSWSRDDDVTICNNLRAGKRYYYDRTTPPPRYENDYDLQRCKDIVQQYWYLMQGLTIMSLLLMIWGLCLAIFSVSLRVKSFCCSCKQEITEKEDDDALLTSNPSDHVIIA